jgi:CMP-N,N'-diacetyllegionaminic acid synthase
VNILSIIPARGGSKGLPGKNIRPMCGHPLIAYSILAAQSARLINRVVVSTDDPNIANVAKQYGAEVPVMRPAEYAEDKSNDYDVFSHMLNWLKVNENYTPDYVVQFRPTSPIRQIDHINDAIDKLISSSCDSLRIVTEAPITPYKMWNVSSFEEPMVPLIQQDHIYEPYNQARQSLPKVYWQTGYLDVIKWKTIMLHNSMSGKSILPFFVDQKYAIDIDNIDDFEAAERYMFCHQCIKF